MCKLKATVIYIINKHLERERMIWNGKKTRNVVSEFQKKTVLDWCDSCNLYDKIGTKESVRHLGYLYDGYCNKKLHGKGNGHKNITVICS